MKGRTGSSLSRTKYVKCFRVETSCYRVVLQKFIVTVELIYDQTESDFVQCQTKMRAFASRMCSEFKQIELNWNSKNFKFKCFMESGLLYNPTMKQTNLRTGCKSALQPGTMTGRRSETFEDLLYLFSSEDKYKGKILKGRLTDRLESTTALSILNGPKSFFVASRLIAEVNHFFKNTGHTG